MRRDRTPSSALSACGARQSGSQAGRGLSGVLSDRHGQGAAPMSTAMRHTAMSLEQATRIFYLLNFTRWFPVGFVVGIFIPHPDRTRIDHRAGDDGSRSLGLRLLRPGTADQRFRRRFRPPGGLWPPWSTCSPALAICSPRTSGSSSGAAAWAPSGALDSGPWRRGSSTPSTRGSPGADVDQELSARARCSAWPWGSALIGGLIWWHRSDPSRPSTWRWPSSRCFQCRASGCDLAAAARGATRDLHRRAARDGAPGFRRARPPRHRAPAGDQQRSSSASSSPGSRLVDRHGRLRVVCFPCALRSCSAAPGPPARHDGSGRRGRLGHLALGTWIASKASKRWRPGPGCSARTLNATGVVDGMGVHAHAVRSRRICSPTPGGVNGPAAQRAAASRGRGARNRATVLSINSMFAFHGLPASPGPSLACGPTGVDPGHARRRTEAL